MTAQTWIDRTRDLLLSGTVEAINRLNAGINSSASTLVTEFATGPIVAGSIMEIGTELMYVTSVSGTTVGVMRGYGGSVAAAHSTADIIRSTPAFPSNMILDALNDDLNDLSARGMYQMSTKTFTYTSGTDGYDLASNALGVHRVTYTDPGTDKSEPEVRRWTIRRNRDTATFASGVALVLQDIPTSGQTVRVEYKAPFTTLTSAASTLSSTGLHTEGYDLPPLGAALALMSFKPIQRESITHQAPVRRSEEVTSGAISASMRDLRFRRDQRISAEASRLSQLYPTTWLRSGE